VPEWISRWGKRTCQLFTQRREGGGAAAPLLNANRFGRCISREKRGKIVFVQELAEQTKTRRQLAHFCDQSDFWLVKGERRGKVEVLSVVMNWPRGEGGDLVDIRPHPCREKEKREKELD